MFTFLSAFAPAMIPGHLGIVDTRLRAEAECGEIARTHFHGLCGRCDALYVLAILGEKFLTGLIGADLTLQHGFYFLVGYGAEVIVFAVDSYGIERGTGMVLVFVDVAHITFLAVDHGPADHLTAFGIVLVEALEAGRPSREEHPLRKGG